MDKYNFDDCVVKMGEVTVGNTYPLYGMITAIIEDLPGDHIVELNHSIKMRVKVSKEHLELLKKRAFEPGIFVATILSKEPTIVCECSTIVFGKPANMAA